MINAGDPLGSGLVSNLAHPNGNITGLSMLNVDLGGKRLGLLKEVVPSLAQVFVFWNPGNHGNKLIIQNTESAARTMGITLRSMEVRSQVDLDAAFAVATPGQGNGLIVVEDPVTIEHRKRVADFAARARLPAIFGLVQYVEAGGLMSYGNRLLDFYRRSAYFVDRILKGAKPAELPVEQPTTFELVINQKVANALPIRLPQSLLLRADRVIQ
jgi:putative ABC transport system substrate-binding protein